MSAPDRIEWAAQTSAAINALPRDETLVIVPTGSIEQHGPHLGLGEDTRNAAAFAELAARASSRSVVVAPAVWSGISPHHLGFAGTISVRLETFIALITDVCTSIAHHGFRRILLLNGHGGNAAALAATTTQLSEDHGLFVASVSYWSLVADELAVIGESEPGGMGHAGEMETSIALHLRPNTVGELPAADVPATGSGPRAIDFRAPGPITMPLDVRRDTRDGVIGDPTVATAEKGERIVAAVVERLVSVIDDLLVAPVDAAPGTRRVDGR